MKVSNCQFKLAIALILGVTIFFPALCQEQSHEYALNFHELEGLYGKHLGKIRNIAQDPYGFMWFSGEDEKCIYRYDGIKLKLYRKDNLDTNSLGGVDVSVVYADNTGIIWIGFNGSGLDAFNPSTNTFTHYRHDEGNKNSIASDNVLAILKDSQGRFWVGTDHGLEHLNLETGEFTHYKNESDNIYSLSHNFVINIYEDRQGVIWVATAGYPWIISDPQEGGLCRLEPNGTFTSFKHDPNDEHSLMSNKVLSLYEDSRGTFWVGTHGDGLHTMDRKTGRFERHRYDSSQPQKLSRPRRKTIDYFGDIDIVTFITEDHSGAVWIGSMWAGLTRYDPTSKLLTRYENSNGFGDSTTWNGFVSRDGVLWIATQQNVLYRVNPIRKAFEKRNLGTNVSRFLPNDDGTFWAGSTSGLSRFDEKGNLVKLIPIRQKNGEKVGVVDVHRDTDDLLWLGTTDGVFVFDSRTEKYHPLDLGFEGGVTLKILQDQTHSDWKWITTQKGGLVKYSNKKGVIKRYTHDKNNIATIASNQIIQLTDDNEYLWVATADGASRLNKKTDLFLNYLNLQYGGLYKDSRGVVWAGSKNGLFRYDAKSDKFMLTEYHSVVATDWTLAIIEDDLSNLWITTPSSIVRIDSSREIVNQFGPQSGIEQSSIMGGAIYKTDKGNILVGNTDGYYRFDPNDFKDKKQSPNVVFTEFLIHGSNNATNQTNILKAPANEIVPVTLRHNQNTFSIGFLFPDYRELQGNHFQARLLGYDDTWRDLASQNSSNYFVVPPGSYTYELRAYTYSGSVREKSIAIVISPPWWKTWWAYSSYAVSFSMMIWMLTSYRSRRLKAENIRLEENVNKRTIELEQSLSEKYHLIKKVESQEALLKERLRISRELHDDIGSTLSSISIYSEVAKTRTSRKENTNEVLSKIGHASRELIDKMSDIVWSLNPNNESFEQLQNRMMAFAALILASRDILFDFTADEKLKGIQFTGEQRKNIFLIFKEALNNIVKYADCKTARITLSVENNILIMSIKDDGKGFDVSEIADTKFANGESFGGNGLKNMRARADYVNAKLCINSEINEGTTIQLTLRL